MRRQVGTPVGSGRTHHFLQQFAVEQWHHIPRPVIKRLFAPAFVEDEARRRTGMIQAVN